MGLGTLPSPRRAGAGSLCSAPRQCSFTLSFVTAPFAAAEDDVLACPGVPQKHHGPTHPPGTTTATLCPALCTLVTQAMATGSDCPLGIRFHGFCDFTCQGPGWRQQPPVRCKRRNMCVCVCVSKRGQYCGKAHPSFCHFLTPQE